MHICTKFERYISLKIIWYLGNCKTKKSESQGLSQGQIIMHLTMLNLIWSLIKLEWNFIKKTILDSFFETELKVKYDGWKDNRKNDRPDNFFCLRHTCIKHKS